MNSQKGQIALIVLLIAAGMLTVGLSVAQKSLFDVKVSRQEEDAARAFQAAETGVEQALRTLTQGEVPLGGGLSYNVSVANKGGEGLLTTTPVPVGEIMELDMKGKTATSVDIYYRQKTGTCADSGVWGLEVETVQDGGSRVTFRSLYMSEPNNQQTFQGQAFCKVIRVALTDNPQLIRLRVRPVGVMDQAILPFGTLIGLGPIGGTFPGQYQLIRSEGKTGEGVTRAVNVTRSVPQLLTIFDYALFSGSGLVKNKLTYEEYQPDPEDFSVEWSVPNAGEEWPAGPANVIVKMNMDLYQPDSKLEVKSLDGITNYSQGNTTFDGAQRMRREVQNLSSGDYKVEWKACVKNNSCKTGSFTFKVNTLLQNTGYANNSDGGGNDTITVKIEDGGLNVANLIIDKDDTVKWKNNRSSGKRRVITDYHDATRLHVYYPQLKTSLLSPGDTDTFKFTDKGMYYYHLDDKDDNLVTGYNGIVVVK